MPEEEPEAEQPQEEEEGAAENGEDELQGVLQRMDEVAAGEDEEEMGIDEMADAAPDENEPPPEASPPEADPDEDDDVEEHLKDAVEGSFRLKRLLLADDGPGAKKAKTCERTPEEEKKIKQLLTRWALTEDAGSRHVIENTSSENLDALIASKFVPQKNHPKKTPSELISSQLLEMVEKTMVQGTKLDIVSSFRFTWKLDMDAEKKLRELNHKDLRYVIDNYDGTAALEDVITDAALEPPDEVSTFGAAPQGPGAKVMSRFNRLELIDPLADSAVFGDANLTFSMNLARHRKQLGHVGRVIATTFEEIETLRERYKEVDESIVCLEEHHAEVYHGVDCTRIAIDSRFKGMEGSLGAVYYNFPHSGAVQGFFDSHPLVNWRHENLMRLFFRGLRSFVKPGGFVKVSSNAGAVGVRYSYIVGGALQNEFLHVETMPFLEWHLHRYGRSYGDRRDVYKRPDAKNNESYAAQNASRDMVYCFCYKPTGKSLGPQQIRPPPTLQTLRGCKDGPFEKVSGAAKEELAKQLHERFLKECSGTHVG
mmetsp:Transcript_655/g.1108  ORF Transcript_655/g.1108 Transcript_655/m.1108 type:complete len:539 (+) Transcript_655:51-1667(+)|eukprot:CAMPEP_0169095970 /NCGR_PEP_ID=MMETSP1015-20121227/18754_1 /TAXON_ID=342587 /ORGANISM="Karlodinium micrum, Strain CCMP2283" /LENGTH=538 /DNA_ID=CAMNT_0009156713 /DNA_START=50 /DNA_END=1666 /DNA_ORIENTATION=+